MSEPDHPQIYLITPHEFSLSAFPDQLAAALDAEEVACLRLTLSATDRDDIARAADACREVAHARDVAVVLTDHIKLAPELGLDGVHLSDPTQMRTARKDLGTDPIVGTYCGTSRHTGLTAAEIGADYVCFGPAGENDLGDGSRAEHTLFEWWSKMIEIPVVAEGALTPELTTALAPVVDWIALGPEIWSSDAPGAMLSTFAKTLK